MTRIIDAHQHFWRTAAQEQPWRTAAHDHLVRDFEPDDLRQELMDAGVSATVLMQSVDEPEENDRLAAYADDPMVAGVVAWLPLADAAAAMSTLDGLDIPKLRGVRCLIADDPLDWLADDDHVALFGAIAERGLAWDVVPITHEQTAAVLRLAELVPSLRIVIDHLGRPPVETAGWEPWATLMQKLAARPNVAIKISVGINVLTAWEAWDAEALRRYVDAAIGWFGPARSMLASNWPVVLLRQSYGQAWRDLAELALANVSAQADRDAILGGSAIHWYRLDA